MKQTIKKIKISDIPNAIKSMGIDQETMINLTIETFQNHELWERGKSWKSLLNNMQLILQPYLYFNFISKWLKILPIPQLTLGFPRLIAKINEVNYLHYLVYLWDDFCYSSA